MDNPEGAIIQRFFGFKTLLNKEYDIDLFVSHDKIYINDKEAEAKIFCPSLDAVKGYVAALETMEKKCE